MVRRNHGQGQWQVEPLLARQLFVGGRANRAVQVAVQLGLGPRCVVGQAVTLVYVSE
ncbi:MAG: hypothetical protein ACREOM_15330 [Candidatus Dormibacteraceae bacterium]